MNNIKNSLDMVDCAFDFSYGTQIKKSDFNKFGDYESAILNEAEVQGWQVIDITPDVIKDFYLPKDAKKIKALKAPKSDRVYITYTRFDGRKYYRRADINNGIINLSVDNKKAFIDFSMVCISAEDFSFRR